VTTPPPPPYPRSPDAAGSDDADTAKLPVPGRPADADPAAPGGEVPSPGLRSDGPSGTAPTADETSAPTSAADATSRTAPVPGAASAASPVSGATSRTTATTSAASTPTPAGDATFRGVPTGGATAAAGAASAGGAGVGADGGEAPAASAGRRRWWVWGIVAAVVVLVVAGCVGVVAGAVGIADRIGDDDAPHRRVARVDDACLALETRLNRVAPPGAAATPRERATAIRNENAAVEPFLDELRSVGDERRSGLWQRLVDARVAYADALDRQAGTGQPAFFVPPRTDNDRSVLDRLEAGREACAAAVRRLGAPDL